MKNWVPSYYDQNSFMQYTIAMAMLNNLPLEGNETILDVGSGSGKVTFEITKRVPQGQVVGLDISDQMIKFAKQHYHAKNLSFKKEDVVHMTYQHYFDVIVSFWTLSWVENQRAALINIVRSLKEKGRLLLMYPMRHDVYDVIDRIIKRSEWKEYFEKFNSPRPFINEDAYRAILKDLKLETLDVIQKQLECNFDNKNNMMRSIKSWLPHIDKIPDENQKNSFVEAIVHEYLHSKNTNAYIMYFNVLEISGVKP